MCSQVRVLAAVWTERTRSTPGGRYIPHEGDESTLTQTKVGNSLRATCRPNNAHFQLPVLCFSRAPTRVCARLQPLIDARAD